MNFKELIYIMIILSFSLINLFKLTSYILSKKKIYHYLPFIIFQSSFVIIISSFFTGGIDRNTLSIVGAFLFFWLAIGGLNDYK